MKNAKMPITAISEMKNIIHEVPLVHTELTLSEGHTHASPLPINTTTSTSSTSGTTYPCLSVAVEACRQTEPFAKDLQAPCKRP